MDDLRELRKRRAEEWRLARERDAAVPCNEVNPPSGAWTYIAETLVPFLLILHTA